MMEPEEWEKMYREEEVEKMPWYLEGLDPDLDRALVELGIKEGTFLDLCTGPGTQAVALAERGFDVTAADVSPSATERAAWMARKRGVKVEFVTCNILKNPFSRSFDYVFDRGCFHTFSPERRAEYIESVAGLVRCFLFLKCFSYRERMEEGPYRFRPEELATYFDPFFRTVSIRETVFHGTLDPFPKALFAVMKRRGAP